MRRILMTSLLLLTTKLIRGFNPYRKATMDLTRIKMTIWYLQSIKTLRLFFIGILAAGACLVILMIGLVLFHLAIVLYAPWSDQVKMGVTLACAVFYISVAAGSFIYVFAEDRWLKVFQAKGLIKELNELCEQGENGRPSNN